MRRAAILLLLTWIFVIPAAAQSGGYTPYAWVEGDLALAYPAGWDVPVAGEENGLPALHLAQALAAAPETRPPGIPYITLTFFLNDNPETDPSVPLQAVLQAMGIAPGVGAPGVLLGFDAATLQGVSADEVLFGLGRAVWLTDNRILVIAGRSLAAQHETFTDLFNTVADSVVSGALSEPVLPAYGVLWHTTRTLADGEGAFVNLIGITIGSEPSSNVLYAVDANAGVVALDRNTGAVMSIYPFDLLTAPSDITLDTQGLVAYVSDTVCQCVQPLYDGFWSEPYYGFEAGAPRSLAPYPDGFYAASQTETEAGVIAFNTQLPGSSLIPLNDGVNDQPLLTTGAAGKLLAMTADGRVWMLDGEAFRLLYELNTVGLLVNDFAVLPDGYLLLATANQGLLLFNSDGEVTGSLGRIVLNSPLPGDFVSPQAVAVGADGTIYVADSDGTFGAVTALSTRVQAGRVGSTLLAPGHAVQGTLNTQTPQQDWTLIGTAGQRVTISAVDTNGGLLDMALRLIAPDGREMAYNDDLEAADLPNVTDAQITDYTLPVSGRYTVRVELVNGSGGYSLGVNSEQVFELSADGVTRLSGELPAALPVARWIFEGKAGQTLTFTMQAQGGTLDALLRLLDANHTVIAENDDAEDTALGKDAQLVQVRLPTDGTYILEAGRFAGDGAYTLVIVATS